MHKITKNLQKFYDSAAEKFSGTRQRDWPEFTHILNAILASPRIQSGESGKVIRILEFGCGDGRLLTYLRKHLTATIEYIGVDISYNLLAIANKNHPDARWIHADISTRGQQIQQETFDIIIGVASFHHLPTRDKRNTTLAALYSGLCYGGSIILTNRCYSDWFREKFASEIRRALFLSRATLGYKSAHDIMVPWKNNDGSLVARRLYHIFSQKELGELLAGGGFTKVEQRYVDSTGGCTSDERQGRNMVSVGVKSIYA